MGIPHVTPGILSQLTCRLQRNPLFRAYSHFYSLVLKQFWWFTLHRLVAGPFLDRKLNSSGPANSPALPYISFHCGIIHSVLSWLLFVVCYLLRCGYNWLACNVSFHIPLFSSHQTRPNSAKACFLILCPWNTIVFWLLLVWIWLSTQLQEKKMNTWILAPEHF